MLRKISYDDVIIYDIPLENDVRAAGYNIGDCLNMPSLLDIWEQNPHADNYALERMNLIGENYKNSVLWYYCKNRKENDIVPDIKLIKESVLNFINNNNIYYINIVKDPRCICIHVRNGDCNTEHEYKNYIKFISQHFDKVIILSGIHNDEHFKKKQDKINNFVKTMNEILELNTNIYIYLEKADVHLSIMMHASNLLLHKGGFSCLGSIVSTGKLFITNNFKYNNSIRWIEQVNKQYIQI